MATKVQLRRGTAFQWSSVDPTLSSGEIGFETDSGKFKIGDGSTAWSLLEYFGGEVDLSGYLTLSSASTTYLTQSSASNTYLTQTSASTTYLSQASASTTYLTQASASTIYVDKNLTIVPAKSSAYQIASGDEGYLIELNGTFSVTVPADGTSGFTFPIGTQINFLNIGTGVITFVGSSTTLNGTPGLKLRAQWSSATLIKRAANVWVIVGDLTA